MHHSGAFKNQFNGLIGKNLIAGLDTVEQQGKGIHDEEWRWSLFINAK
jgi:hypothetical protein